MTTKPRPGFDGIIRAEVLELDRPRRMRWSWRSGALDSEVTFDLVAIASGTRMTLRQTGFRGARLLLAWLAMSAGWRKKIFARIGDRMASKGQRSA